MNNPDDMPLDIEELVDWLRDRKERTGMSWPALGGESGIAHQTLGLLAKNNYQGNLANQAKLLFRYRQMVESQAERAKTVLAAPKYVETPSSRRIQALLEIAQMGRITVGAMGPGIGKTLTAKEYARSYSNVWVATMRQSTRTVNAMTVEVLKALGLSKSGWTQQRSDQVIDFVKPRAGLLIVDEANHLKWEALEELRGWHDETGLGIALLGNEELMMRITGGTNRHTYARLQSRIANYHVQDLPIACDIEAYLDALDIVEGGMRKPLIEIGISPGHGGLREVQQILESANVAAIAEHETLGAKHIRAAMASRATSLLRRAA